MVEKQKTVLERLRLMVPILRDWEGPGTLPNLLEEAAYEIDRLNNEIDDLRGFIDGARPHVRAVAEMYGIASAVNKPEKCL